MNKNQPVTIIKFTCKKTNIIRRISLQNFDKNNITYQFLVKTIQELFSLSMSLIPKISWIDDEGDVISISSDHEIFEAISVMEKLSANGYLKFDVHFDENLTPVTTTPTTTTTTTMTPTMTITPPPPSPTIEKFGETSLKLECDYCKKQINVKEIFFQIVPPATTATATATTTDAPFTAGNESIYRYCCFSCEGKFNVSQQFITIKLYSFDQHQFVKNFIQSLDQLSVATENASPSSSPASPSTLASLSFSSSTKSRDKLWKFVPKRSHESDSETDWRKSSSATQSATSSTTSSSWSEISPNRSSRSYKPMCRFIRDVTFLDGEKVPPSTEFIKTWRIKNDGSRSWPNGCLLAPAGGDHLQIGENIKLPQLEAGNEVDISVTLLSPPVAGRYVSYYRPQTLEGKWFGQRLWADIRVYEPADIFEVAVSYPSGSTLVSTSSSSSPSSSELPPLPSCPPPLHQPLHQPPHQPHESTNEQPNSRWQYELSILNCMGFIDHEECIAKLESYSTSNGQPRSSAEIVQLAVLDLLRK